MNTNTGDAPVPYKEWQSTVSPPYPQVLHLQIQITRDQKYSEKNCRKFKKQKVKLACTVKYLHRIYIVLGVISNTEMI